MRRGFKPREVPFFLVHISLHAHSLILSSGAFCSAGASIFSYIRDTSRIFTRPHLTSRDISRTTKVVALHSNASSRSRPSQIYCARVLRDFCANPRILPTTSLAACAGFLGSSILLYLGEFVDACLHNSKTTWEWLILPSPERHFHSLDTLSVYEHLDPQDSSKASIHTT